MSEPQKPSPTVHIAPESDPAPESARPKPVVVALSLVLTIGLVVAVLVIAYLVMGKSDRTALHLSPIEAPDAAHADCTRLGQAMPRTLGDYDIAEIEAPVPPSTAAYRTDKSDAPIVVRCGLKRPTQQDFQPVQVGEVLWLKASAPGGSSGSTWWLSLKRSVVVGVELPSGSGSAPIQELSAKIAESNPLQS